MEQASIYQPRTASPTSFGMVVLLHGAAIAALVFAKMEMPVPPGFITTTVDTIPIEPPPPENIPPHPKTELPKPQVRHFEPIVKPPPRDDDTVQSTETDRSFVDKGMSRTVEAAEEIAPPKPPPPAPVRKAARLLSGSDLEPPYPASERHAGTEGSVTVRVAIGPDGKVVRAEKVRATNDAFFQATQRHAVRNWRFRPATLDGRPVESSQVLTVHFKLEGDA